MNKRQIKKLAKQGLEELKAMKNPMPISNKKIRNALFLYLWRTYTEPDNKRT